MPDTVADGMLDMAETIERCAELIRPHEPLPIDVLRKHGMRFTTAQIEYHQAMGALMRDLGGRTINHD